MQTALSNSSLTSAGEDEIRYEMIVHLAESANVIPVRHTEWPMDITYFPRNLESVYRGTKP